MPLLWDKKLSTAVNNESSEIIRMFNSEFNAFAKYPALDLYPSLLRPKIDEWNAMVYEKINDGVYKTGFATNQQVYETHCTQLFDALDVVERALSSSKFLTGNEMTEADVRLFTTILRYFTLRGSINFCGLVDLILFTTDISRLV